MSEDGKAAAKRAVESLTSSGSTNIRDGLDVAAMVLDGRRHKINKQPSSTVTR